jgi:ABC-2 type transport system permease protein
MPGNDTLIVVKDRGWLNGFSNIFRKESHAWWGTWRWLIQILIWAAIINGILTMVVLVAPNTNAQQGGLSAAELSGISQEALTIFFIFVGMAPAVGVVILGQEAIIHEKQTGTAAWVLSKPLSRVAFILSKLASDALGILVTMVLVQGLLASLIYWLAIGHPVQYWGFLAGLGLAYLVLLFYLCLTLMLGALFHIRGPVIGIPMILIFGYQLFGIAPVVYQFMPWNLVMDLGPQQPSLAYALATGQPLPTVTPIIGTVVLSVIFIAVTLWRFQREEF